MCCTLPCYLDNRSAFGVMAHNTSDSSSLVFLQRDSYWGLSQPRLRMNWGEGTLALTPSRTWTTTWRRKGLLPFGDSWSSISKYYHIAYIDISYNIYYHGQKLCEPILWISNNLIGFSDVPGSSTSSSKWSRLNRDKEEKGIVAGLRNLRLRRWSLSGAQAGDIRRQQSLSPPCRGSCVWGSQSQSSFPPIHSQPWLR